MRVLWAARRSNQSILKEISPWIFIGKTDAEAPIFWPPDAKRWLTGKDPDAGKNWGQQEKGWQRMRLHHWFNRHELEQTLGDGEGQGSLACCSPWIAQSWSQISVWKTVDKQWVRGKGRAKATFTFENDWEWASRSTDEIAHDWNADLLWEDH